MPASRYIHDHRRSDHRAGARCLPDQYCTHSPAHRHQLREVTSGLHLVTERTEPIGSIIGEINNDLAGVDDALRAVLAK